MVSGLRAGAGSAVPKRSPDTVQDLALNGSMGDYVWTINGRAYDQTQPLTVRQGQTGAQWVVLSRGWDYRFGFGCRVADHGRDHFGRIQQRRDRVTDPAF